LDNGAIAQGTQAPLHTYTLSYLLIYAKPNLCQQAINLSMYTKHVTKASS